MRPGRKKGTPKTGGRQKGTPNKATVAVKEAAREHGPDAIKELARLMKHAESERVRIMACREILDRAYGKPRQTLEHTGNDAKPIVISDIADREKMRRLVSFMLEDKATGAIIDNTTHELTELCAYPSFDALQPADSGPLSKDSAESEKGS